MSSLVGVTATTAGCLGSARNAVFCAASGYWWAFALTGTQTLASYWSNDGVTWNAGATHSLFRPHAAEGRDLQVAYASIGGQDVVHFLYVGNPTTQWVVSTVRATISGSTVTYHVLDTDLTGVTGVLAAPAYSSGGWELDSNNRVYAANGALDTNQDVSWCRSTTGDAGLAEQASVLVYGIPAIIDNSQAQQVKSQCLIEIGAGSMALVTDDGTAAGTCTGLAFYKWNGSSWSGTPGNQAVTGIIAAIDKNDWGVVKLSNTDIHVVYRNSAGNLIHRRWNGTTWSAGQTMAVLGNASGTGIALATDGTNVYCFAIANDAANTVVFTEWTAGVWDAYWTTLEATTATRAFLSCASFLQSGKVPVFWHEGTNLRSALLDTNVGTGGYSYYPYWFNSLRVM